MTCNQETIEKLLLGDLACIDTFSLLLLTLGRCHRSEYLPVLDWPEPKSVLLFDLRGLFDS